MTLADLIAPGSGSFRLHFPDEATSVDYGTLWADGAAVGCLRSASDGRPVAAALSNTRACASVVVGAIAAGQPLLSLPMPGRGTSLEWYSRFIQGICARSGASTMLLDGAVLPLIPPMEDVTFVSYEDALTLRGPSVVDSASFTLTQFTSGSTADPKGILLSGAEIAANLIALLDWLAPVPGDGACTWLPLSHDMGLIGMFLCSLAGAGDSFSRGGDLVVMTPKGFLWHPTHWLEACEAFGSTITAAPNYGYDMAARRRAHVHDLGRLRVCIAGAEPVRAASLERFSCAFEASGFHPTAFCPAYGMAEAALAVSATPTDVPWHAANVETAADHTGDEMHMVNVVSSGTPLRGYEVRIAGTGVGEILVRGPSIALSYADGQPVADADGWFHTRDLGVVREGQLYVLGRTDDVFQVAGRNIYAVDVEAYAGEVTGVRDGRVVAPVRPETAVHPSATAINLLAHTREHDTPHRMPKRVSLACQLLRSRAISQPNPPASFERSDCRFRCEAATISTRTLPPNAVAFGQQRPRAVGRDLTHPGAGGDRADRRKEGLRMRTAGRPLPTCRPSSAQSAETRLVNMGMRPSRETTCLNAEQARRG